MARPSACSRFKLRALWLEFDQTKFHRVVSRHNGQGFSRKKRERDNAYEDKRLLLR